MNLTLPKQPQSVMPFVSKPYVYTKVKSKVRLTSHCAAVYTCRPVTSIAPNMNSVGGRITAKEAKGRATYCSSISMNAWVSNSLARPDAIKKSPTSVRTTGSIVRSEERSVGKGGVSKG